MKFKSGFTLIELVVYMAILGFVIVVAGRVFSDSTGMRIRTQNMTKATETANAAAALLKEDIGRMGVKLWKDVGVNNAVFTVNKNVYRKLDAPNADTSSFVLERAEPAEPGNPSGKFDELVFNTMDFNPDGTFLAVREIRYRVNEIYELVRQCKTIDGAPDLECPEGNSGNEWDGILTTVIAANAETFSLNPSIPGVRPQDGTLDASIAAANESPILFSSVADPAGFTFIPRETGNNVLGGLDVRPTSPNKVVLSGFKKNDAPEDVKFSQVFLAKQGAGECEEFSFFPGETYVIDFDLPPIPPPAASSASEEFCRMCLFQPGIDHIALGLRNKGNPDEALMQRVPDFVVFPPPIQSTDNAIPHIRHQEFSVPIDASGDPYIPLTACISLTFAFYSPMVSAGKLEFSNFAVFRKTDEVYHFATEENAYAYNPGITSNANIALKAKVKAFELELSVKIKDEIAKAKIVIPVPSNGVFARSTLASP